MTSMGYSMKSGLGYGFAPGYSAASGYSAALGSPAAPAYESIPSAWQGDTYARSYTIGIMECIMEASVGHYV